MLFFWAYYWGLLRRFTPRNDRLEDFLRGYLMDYLHFP
jgi:hypothetical protein